MKKIDIIFLNTIIFFTLLFDKTIESQVIVSIFYLIYIFLYKRIEIKNKILILFIFINVISIFNILINEYTFFKMFQQIIVISILLLTYYNFFLNYDLKVIWNKYIKIAQLFALVGILQIFVYYFFSFNFCKFILIFLGYNNNNNYIITEKILMCSSLCGEPGMYAQVIMPATFFCLENIIKNKKIKIEEFILIISYFLSYVTIAYFGIVVYLGIKFLIVIFNKEKLKLVLLLLVSIISSYIFIKCFEFKAIKQKFCETFITLFNVLEIDLHSVNLSTFALMSNLRACILSNNYYLGNGIGTIEQVYYKFFKNLDYYAYGLNATDGYSLGIRLLTECGLLGLIIVFFIVLKNIDLQKKDYIYNVINFCSLIGIISYLVRGGSYFRQGTIIFFMFLIFSKKKLMEEKIKL